MKQKIVILHCLLVLLISNIGYGQSALDYPDAGSWNTLNINFDLSKKLSLGLTQEFRLKENYSRLNLFYTELGMEYKLNKNVKTSLKYRLTEKNTDYNNISLRHRISWDANFKTKYRKFSFSYRHRLQVEYRNAFSSLTGLVPEYYSRSKFGAEYQLNKRFSPYFTTELRYQIQDDRNIESEHQFHRIRYQFGFDYVLNSYSKLGVYYLIQREWNVKHPEKLFITGLEYSVDIHDVPVYKKLKKRKN